MKKKIDPVSFILNYNHLTDWFHESQISKNIVNHLEQKHYKIVKDNSDNCKLRGEDIIAIDRLGTYEVIEVKGYPTEYHTKGEKKGQVKPTNPKLQAKHWFSEALLSSIFNYEKHKEREGILLCIGFPKIERYVELINKAKPYFTANKIEIRIYFVDEKGQVTIDNLNANNT